MDIVSSSLVPVDELSAARAIGRFLSQGAANLPPDAAASLVTLQATLEGRGTRTSSSKSSSKKRKTEASSSSRVTDGSATEPR